MKLYHYTCKHGNDAILKDGHIKPNPLTGLAWFTDMDVPDRNALGLTSQVLDCDRMEYRFTVTENERTLPYHWIRRFLPNSYRDALELVPGAMLMHWWVAQQPIELDTENEHHHNQP